MTKHNSVSRHLATAGALALFFSTATAAADCGYPRDTSIIPNGASATEEEMLEAKKSVTGYVASLQAYIDCLAVEIDNADEESTPEQVEMQIKRHNAAVDQMESVANRYNDQLRLFKSRD